MDGAGLEAVIAAVRDELDEVYRTAEGVRIGGSRGWLLDIRGCLTDHSTPLADTARSPSPPPSSVVHSGPGGGPGARAAGGEKGGGELGQGSRVHGSPRGGGSRSKGAAHLRDDAHDGGSSLSSLPPAPGGRTRGTEGLGRKLLSGVWRSPKGVIAASLRDGSGATVEGEGRAMIEERVG
ncbi:unnamed protein product, partial [Discosporangium mesarthrocarpum]